MNQDWINPAIVSLGPFSLRWYSVLFLISFLLAVIIIRFLAHKKFWPLEKNKIDPFVICLFVGMIIGARLTYVFLYHWDYYAGSLWDIFAIWKGGLSFHGGFFGMLIVTAIFSWKYKVPFLALADCLALSVTPGLFLGRIGNFINGELYGRVTDSWIGVVFPGGGPFPRHPTQIYEAILEGVGLFFLLFFILKRERFYGVITGAFLLIYGTVRFFIEFFREPDVQLGYFFSYSVAMLPMALIILKWAKTKNYKNPLLPR